MPAIEKAEPFRNTYVHKDNKKNMSIELRKSVHGICFDQYAEIPQTRK